MTAVLTTFPRWHYLAVLLACLLATLPLELVLGARVYRRPLRLAATIGIAATPFVIWDALAVRAGHWWFSARHTLGIELFASLPLEEVLFFVVIPICALLTHGAVTALLARREPRHR